MNGTHQNGKNHNFEKYPGCLGRMVNLFELNLGVAANKLLTDKPHRDGSPLSRSRSDVSRMSPSGDQVEEKVIVSQSKNTSPNRKSNGTPMKMLIAQEMSKDVDSRRSPPNLVAKLMGLDALPPQEPEADVPKSHRRAHPRRHSDIPLSYWEQQNGLFHYVEPNEYKDVHEIWQQSQKSPHKGRCNEITNHKRMALVREKFDEAKRLSMDGKLRQSKQFQDALDVLNSNKDLFLKCLEPDSMFSEPLCSLQSLPPETKRITVLRPSKVTDNSKCAVADKDGKQMRRSAFLQPNGSEKILLESCPPSAWQNYENPSQPTRIVVLKPSPGKPLDIMAMDLPQSESPRILHCENFFPNVEDDEQESREVAKAITQQMREKLGRHRRDETLISSVFSNGYVGDESSFNKSEIDSEGGNFSDSEAVSPVSRHSWDYVNRIGSPYSSSFSRASYSPESSVCREAKKRLSERWAMMASNGSYQEQRHIRRSSSTLGEMLALSEAKKEARPVGEGISTEAPRVSNCLSVNEERADEIMDNSPRNLMRSKSLPVSSTELGSRLNVDVSALAKGKPEALKEAAAKASNSKSSFKGKVSNLFFSRNKKSSKDKFPASETKNELDSAPREMSGNRPDCVSEEGPNHLSLGVVEPLSTASFANLIGKNSMKSHETGAVSKPIASGNPGENQDQPSPVSVLDPPFEEETHTAKLLPHYGKPDRQGIINSGVDLPLNHLCSNLIDKSPPIGSIARTLSWDDSCVDTASSYHMKASLTARGTDEEEEEWFFFVKTLLSEAGLLGEVRSDSLLARWHSPESPLDPSLRDKYVDLKDKETTMHEAKRRQKRSIQKLVFDCVNLVLVDIAGYGSDSGQRAIPCIRTNITTLEDASPTMLDEVWARMTVWLSSESKCAINDYSDDNSQIVEGLVKKEVVGKGWVDHLRLETDNLGKEFEDELLEELVDETVAELTGRIL